MNKTNHFKMVRIFIVFWLFFSIPVLSDEIPSEGRTNQQILSICNKILTCSVLIKDKSLILDRLESGNEWKSVTGIPETLLETDADFRFQVVWAGWRAPGKVNNADNAVLFSKKDFVLLGHEVHKHSDGSQELILLFKGVNNPFELKIMYDLGKNAFYIRRRLASRDSDYKHHFLQWVWPRYGFVDG
ncbi:MAG: hypothetical protein KAT17_00940, partial [Candidatus Aminicenantes bacterium]|nr:hypothetical protein [Candidatus Aminicenantes bacterium]